MGALTEIEIFDCMGDNLQAAAADCVKLAGEPRKADNYHSLRTKLALVEGSCRQAAAWRGDTRWLAIGMKMNEAHKRAGNWLRERDRGVRAQKVLLFLKLAEALGALYTLTQQYRHQRTGTLGPILPEPLKGPLRQRPVHVSGFKPSRSGLLVPA